MKGGGILIVEDEGILAMGIGEMLERGGYRVAAIVATAEDALLEAKRRRPDLVLMDVRLKGGGDGIEAAREIKATCPAPVVFLTAYADDETIARVKTTEPYGYLIKPFDERHLLITIEMALTKHRAELRAFEALELLKKSNAQLERQRGFLTALFDSIPCAVLVLGPDDRIRSANPFLLRMFGTTEEAILGQFTGDALGCSSAHHHPGTCAHQECAQTCTLRRAMSDAFSGIPVHRVKADFQVLVDGALKEKRLLVSAAPVTFDNETLCVLILEDVTELAILRQMLDRQGTFAGIVGRDRKMKELFALVAEVAQSNVPVLIQGESGTRKELVALAIHGQGPRADGPFIAINCGALPDGLLESELFGHVKGAFTGAVRDKKGRFELAHGGTLFLDEVGDLSPPMQVKLLRVLQGGRFERVGGDETIQVDVRLISATNRDLKAEVEAGRFRADLFYRLCVVPLHIPPLRERREDIPFIAEHLLEKVAKECGLRNTTLSSQALNLLNDYHWPGNVSELENTLQFALLKSRGQVIRPEHLPPILLPKNAPGAPKARRARKLKPELVTAALAATKGNKVRAAQELGVSRATLYRFLGELPPAQESGTG